MGMVERLAASLRDVTPEAWLEAVRTFRDEAMREIESAQRQGVEGLAIAQQLTELTNAIVLAAYGRAASQPVGPHALVALGGFGRGEMAPYSDIDLLFLFKRDRDKAPEFIAGVLHPLWDLGFEVGHSSRTVGEVVKMAREDVDSCTAMMDGRLLVGDADLFAEYGARLFKRVPKSVPLQLNKWRDRKSTRLNSSHSQQSRMPSSA